MSRFEYQKKIVDLDNALKIVSDLRSKGKKVVFTNGCFDILHMGHIRYLCEAKSLGDFLIVGLNSDNSVKRIKGSFRPIQDERSRAELLASIGFIDMVILFEEDTPIQLITRLRPDVLVKGGDWDIKDIVGAKEVLEAGGRVEVIRYLPNYSTSSIVERILRSAKNI